MQEPKFMAPVFKCPHCEVVASMEWDDLWADSGPNSWTQSLWHQATCAGCNKVSLWEATDRLQSFDELRCADSDATMIHPRILTTPKPHVDLPISCQADYEEAREIAGVSPRGAAALLRLVVQKLCMELGQPGENINQDIKALVRAGLDVDAQQALDVLRITGNNAVHPSEMDLAGNRELVTASFDLVNHIVDHQISRKKRIARMFDALPDGAKAAIARRDAT